MMKSFGAKFNITEIQKLRMSTKSSTDSHSHTATIIVIIIIIIILNNRITVG